MATITINNVLRVDDHYEVFYSIDGKDFQGQMKGVDNIESFTNRIFNAYVLRETGFDIQNASLLPTPIIPTPLTEQQQAILTLEKEIADLKSTKDKLSQDLMSMYSYVEAVKNAYSQYADASIDAPEIRARHLENLTFTENLMKTYNQLYAQYVAKKAQLKTLKGE